MKDAGGGGNGACAHSISLGDMPCWLRRDNPSTRLQRAIAMQNVGQTRAIHQQACRRACVWRKLQELQSTVLGTSTWGPSTARWAARKGRVSA